MKNERAIWLLCRGSTLQNTGGEWSLCPGGGLAPQHARKLIADLRLVATSPALLPGMEAQQYRLVTSDRRRAQILASVETGGVSEAGKRALRALPFTLSFGRFGRDCQGRPKGVRLLSLRKLRKDGLASCDTTPAGATQWSQRTEIWAITERGRQCLSS